MKPPAHRLGLMATGLGVIGLEATVPAILDADAPIIQERAWTSPIWAAPAGTGG